jgi:hypothetical protein
MIPHGIADGGMQRLTGGHKKNHYAFSSLFGLGKQVGQQPIVLRTVLRAPFIIY